MQPCKGNGNFQWNLGWFGAQIGATISLVILGLSISLKDVLPGLTILACGLIPNVVGYQMWKRRDVLAPYPAIQGLLFVIFIFTAIAFFTAKYSMHHDEWRSITEFSNSEWILLIFPAMMLFFHYINFRKE